MTVWIPSLCSQCTSWQVIIVHCTESHHYAHNVHHGMLSLFTALIPITLLTMYIMACYHCSLHWIPSLCSQWTSWHVIIVHCTDSHHYAHNVHHGMLSLFTALNPITMLTMYIMACYHCSLHWIPSLCSQWTSWHVIIVHCTDSHHYAHNVHHGMVSLFTALNPVTMLTMYIMACYHCSLHWIPSLCSQCTSCCLENGGHFVPASIC